MGQRGFLLALHDACAERVLAADQDDQRATAAGHATVFVIDQ
ncbi:hypothetical protein [Plantactinospora sp. B5E13]